MVSIAGTGEALDPYVLTFTIPRGNTGDTGPMGMQGNRGEAGIFYVPVYFDPTGDAQTWDATLTLAEGLTEFTYVPSDDAVFGNPPSLSNFSPTQFRNEFQSRGWGRHCLLYTSPSPRDS